MTPDELALAHLPLVRQVVQAVSVGFPKHVDRNELAAAGALGLVEAAHRFDPGLGVPFNRFAERRIRGAIIDSCRHEDWIPRSVRQLARRDPASLTVGERVRVTRANDRTPVYSLDYPARLTDDTHTLAELLTDLDNASDNIDDDTAAAAVAATVLLVAAAVKHLHKQQRTVITGYFLRHRTSTQLAAQLGVSESRVSQIRTAAVAALRHQLGDAA